MDVKEKIVTINDIPVYNFESLEPLLYTDSNKIHIVNFWAMWCAPCIKELPILKEFEINNPNVEITLVSLDFPEDIETRLKPFLERKGITSKVVLLDDPDQNSWINKIDPNWSGAIPFTIIFNNENRTFHERAFNDIKDLENEVYNTINK
ncbi:MAG TPA: thioredoxin [Maribacter sp.]|nr:thioredoxin [Maribacter sp.]|tara:strand:- start:15674 stop:16123 length:450 start_codon:yes stop_codon:yes gene_type:complete